MTRDALAVVAVAALGCVGCRERPRTIDVDLRGLKPYSICIGGPEPAGADFYEIRYVDKDGKVLATSGRLPLPEEWRKP